MMFWKLIMAGKSLLQCSTAPDMILLDVQLGDMDGRDICLDLKQEPATAIIPIMMISASHGRRGLREKACDANDFLAKPFDVAELIARVSHYNHCLMF